MQALKTLENMGLVSMHATETLDLSDDCLQGRHWTTWDLSSFIQNNPHKQWNCQHEYNDKMLGSNTQLHVQIEKKLNIHTEAHGMCTLKVCYRACCRNGLRAHRQNPQKRSIRELFSHGVTSNCSYSKIGVSNYLSLQLQKNGFCFCKNCGA